MLETRSHNSMGMTGKAACSRSGKTALLDLRAAVGMVAVGVSVAALALAGALAGAAGRVLAAAGVMGVDSVVVGASGEATVLLLRVALMRALLLLRQTRSQIMRPLEVNAARPSMSETYVVLETSCGILLTGPVTMVDKQ